MPGQALAHQAIGEYLCAFSTLERELGEVIKVIFKVENHEASDTIVAGLGDVSRKINLVWTASLVANNTDGSETSKEFKKSSHATMKKVFSCNTDRNTLAHSFLETKDDGSVECTNLRLEGGELRGQKSKTWSKDDFKTKIKELQDLTQSLHTMKIELSSLRIRIGSALDADAFVLVRPPQISPALWEALDEPLPHIPATKSKDDKT